MSGTKKALFLLLAVGILVAAGILYRQTEQAPEAGSPLTLYGNVEIRKVNLGFRVAGRIAEMAFQEGERVAAGAVVARLESTPYRDELTLALANEEQAAARLAMFEAGARKQEIAQARALVAERRSTAANLDKTLRRSTELVEIGAVSQQQFDDTRSALNEARARLNTAEEALALTREGFRPEEIRAARADLQAAQARTAGARTRVEDTLCKTPQEGVILTRVEEPGAIIAVGQTVMTLALDTPVWIRAYVEEPDLGRLTPGAKALIFTDTRPRHPYRGHVGFISPEAEFTPKTVQTEALRTRLVYQVRILADDPRRNLRQGMPVTVRLANDEH